MCGTFDFRPEYLSHPTFLDELCMQVSTMWFSYSFELVALFHES
jgi:hypothetical protein